jgi:hypothetical protein
MNIPVLHSHLITWSGRVDVMAIPIGEAKHSLQSFFIFAAEIFILHFLFEADFFSRLAS